ncbi:hypothetical protein Q8A73_004152 [Channa argus]|nr:hypothetical protein Q8A73_004152 [Channa argus]
MSSASVVSAGVGFAVVASSSVVSVGVAFAVVNSSSVVSVGVAFAVVASSSVVSVGVAFAVVNSSSVVSAGVAFAVVASAGVASVGLSSASRFAVAFAIVALLGVFSARVDAVGVTRVCLDSVSAVPAGIPSVAVFSVGLVTVTTVSTIVVFVVKIGVVPDAVVFVRLLVVGFVCDDPNQASKLPAQRTMSSNLVSILSILLALSNVLVVSQRAAVIHAVLRRTTCQPAGQHLNPSFELPGRLDLIGSELLSCSPRWGPAPLPHRRKSSEITPLPGSHRRVIREAGISHAAASAPHHPAVPHSSAQTSHAYAA